MLEALFALVVIVYLPMRAWRRHRRHAPPSPPGVYLLEIAVLTGALARLLWNHGVPLEAIGMQPVLLPRLAANVALSVAAVIGLDVLSMFVATHQIGRAHV